MSERIHKIMARSGVASRRHIEAWIQQGRVLVNGQLAVLGQMIQADDQVMLDHQPVSLCWQVATEVLMYHKPLGEICSHVDAQSRPTIYQCLPALSQGKWISIGRLDINSEGLILVTNDGDIAHRQMHPSHAIVREYLTRLSRPVTADQLQQLQRGVMLSDGWAKFDSITPQSLGLHPWFRVRVSEGRNRLVRRLWDTQDVMVSRLIRVAYGAITLPRSLKPGSYHRLHAAEVKRLQS